jgi:hypothetical protein
MIGYRLDGQGVGVQVPVQEIPYFSLLNIIHTGSAVHLASYPMGRVGDLSPEVKQPMHVADH